VFFQAAESQPKVERERRDREGETEEGRSQPAISFLVRNPFITFVLVHKAKDIREHVSIHLQKAQSFRRVRPAEVVDGCIVACQRPQSLVSQWPTGTDGCFLRVQPTNLRRRRLWNPVAVRRLRSIVVRVPLALVKIQIDVDVRHDGSDDTPSLSTIFAGRSGFG
jgi:hypothetical protein